MAAPRYPETIPETGGGWWPSAAGGGFVWHTHVRSMPTQTEARHGVNETPDGDVLWSMSAVTAALCCSETTARRWSRQAGFPAALELGPGIIRWRAEEIVEWRSCRRRPEAMATPAEWQPARDAGRAVQRRGARRAA